MAEAEQQTAKLDFATGEFPDVSELGGAAPAAINVLFDDAGAVHLRPGISTWSGFDQTPLYDSTKAVIGMAIFNGILVWVTSDRLLHRWVTDGFSTDLSDSTAATKLDGSTRPVFAVTRNLLVVAGSGLLQKWNGASALSARLGGSPPPASHVIAISGGLVVNRLGNTGQIQWSDTDPETWPALNFKELENKPDPLRGLGVNTGEVVGMGTETVQMMSPAATTVDNAGTLFFDFQPARNFEWGVASAYSFVQADERYYVLDSAKRIVECDGRGFKVISDPAITGVLQRLETVDDCWGFRLQADGWNLVIFNFPTAGISFCYDVESSKWTEWRGLNAGQLSQFAATSFLTWKERNLHLVGLSDGTIGKLDFDSATDSGEVVVGECVTGFMDCGTMAQKLAVALRMRFKRGLTPVGTTTPIRAQLFFRDDLGAFEGPIELDMGLADDVAPQVEVRALGMFQQRQWKLRFSDSVPCMLASAELVFETSDV